MSEAISKISFPGLGIGEFNVNRVAFTVFGREVMWYGVIICVGIILAFLYFTYRAGQIGVSFDDVLDYTVITVPVAVIGARIYFVLFSGETYRTFYDVIAIWNGGLAIYGAVIFGAISVICISLVKKKDFFKLADTIVPAVMIGQILGRWGNFANGEAFGSDTDIFCRMGLCNRLTGYVTRYVHPTFLYESLWNVIGFILINIFYKKKQYNGEVLLWYFGWYGFGRAFIETLRTDSLYIGDSDIRVSSLFGAICFIVSLAAGIVIRIRQKMMRKAYPDGADCEFESLAVVFGIRKPKNVTDTSADTIEFNTEEIDRAEDSGDSPAKEPAEFTGTDTDTDKDGTDEKGDNNGSDN